MFAANAAQATTIGYFDVFPDMFMPIAQITNNSDTSPFLGTFTNVNLELTDGTTTTDYAFPDLSAPGAGEQTGLDLSMFPSTFTATLTLDFILASDHSVTNLSVAPLQLDSASLEDPFADPFTPLGESAIDFTPAQTAPVPEPSSVLLLGGGLAALVRRRARKRA